MGYSAGLNKIIVDPFALSDPLLARLPALPAWRIGHFERMIPDGYAESILSRQNRIKDEGLREFYDKIRIITQSKNLFGAERLKTVLLMNLGRYDELIAPYIKKSKTESADPDKLYHYPGYR